MLFCFVLSFLRKSNSSDKSGLFVEGKQLKSLAEIVLVRVGGFSCKQSVAAMGCAPLGIGELFQVVEEEVAA